VKACLIIIIVPTKPYNSQFLLCVESIERKLVADLLIRRIRTRHQTKQRTPEIMFRSA